MDYGTRFDPDMVEEAAIRFQKPAPDLDFGTETLDRCREHRFQRAIGIFLQALVEAPDDARLWSKLGNLYYHAGLYEKAVRTLFHSIQLDGNLGWAYSNLGLALMAQGQTREAELLFQKGVSLMPRRRDQAIAWNHLGNLYLALAEFENAFQAHELAEKSHPHIYLILSRGCLIYSKLTHQQEIPVGDLLNQRQP